jgi:hypothetical protein
MSAVSIKMPPRFINDCLECDVDVGEYNKGVLTATPEQLHQLIDRAVHYAGAHVDEAPAGLARAAQNALDAIRKAGAA